MTEKWLLNNGSLLFLVNVHHSLPSCVVGKKWLTPVYIKIILNRDKEYDTKFQDLTLVWQY
jgi:hypothetical protein